MTDEARSGEAEAIDGPEFRLELEQSAAWVRELKDRLGWEHTDKVRAALRSMLHALRDCLPIDEAILLGVHLPTLLRGEYFDGFHPRLKPLPLKNRDEFFVRVHEAVHRDPGIDPEEVARAALALLAQRLPAGEREQIEAACPAPLHGLWPD